MYRTGVYFGRFLPPHRGHLYQMIEASTRCEKLLVVISDNADQTREICRRDGIPEISYRLRKQWISQQIQDITHIGVRVLDETDIPVYPQGWELWSQRMREVVGETISSTGFPVRCRIKNTTTVMPKIAMMDCPSRLSKYFPMLFNLS